MYIRRLLVASCILYLSTLVFRRTVCLQVVSARLGRLPDVFSRVTISGARVGFCGMWILG